MTDKNEKTPECGWFCVWIFVLVITVAGMVSSPLLVLTGVQFQMKGLFDFGKTLMVGFPAFFAVMTVVCIIGGLCNTAPTNNSKEG